MKILRSFSSVSRFASLTLFTAFLLVNSCSTAESRNAVDPARANSDRSSSSAGSGANSSGATIDIQLGGPADTVRAFYKLLREKKFREAIFLTNLRPAIEGLTDSELKDFAVDFEALAGQVPAEIEINGEIVTGDEATVTANLPNEDGDKKELQQIKLRKSGTVWVIRTVDDEAEAKIKKEGKQYFYSLRIETHEDEARQMLDRVSKAQMAYALQNGGSYTDINGLVGAGLLPDDVKSSVSTGYNYSLELAADKRNYWATAYPADYGKSGKLSFLLANDPKGGWKLTSKDNGGKALKK